MGQFGTGKVDAETESHTMPTTSGYFQCPLPIPDHNAIRERARGRSSRSSRGTGGPTG